MKGSVIISLTLTFFLYRPEDFLTALSSPFLPLQANMLTLSLHPFLSFFLSLHPLSLRLSGCLTRASSSLSPRSGPKAKHHHTCLLVPKPEPLSHWLSAHEPGTRATGHDGFLEESSYCTFSLRSLEEIAGLKWLIMYLIAQNFHSNI